MESELLDFFDDLLLVFDGDGTVSEWNAAVPAVTGHAPETLEAMTLQDFVIDEDATRVIAAVDEVLDAGEATIEATLVTADGTHIPYDFKTRRLGGTDTDSFAAIGRNISERVRREQELQHRQQLLRELYEITSDRDRPFTEQVEQLLAVGRAELGTKYGTLSRISGDDYLFEVVDAADDSVQAGDVVPVAATNCELAAETEETLVLGDVARDAPEETDRAGYADWGIACYVGAPIIVDGEVYGTFCFYGTEPRTGQFSNWEVTLVDLMSRWVNYELERRLANERLERQNEKLEQFAAVVSHDLRNPLNVIDGAISMTEETGDLEQLRRAGRAVRRMDCLIEDLLTLARSGSAIEDTEPVPIRQLATECWAVVPTDAATLSVETERTVEADQSRLRQLFENLFRNAVEHGGEAVTVTVGDLSDGFYVADDGPGIPPDERAQVFDTGYTTTDDGTGFGLTIVEEIAEAHGWDVRATESDGGGARFEFTTETT